MSETTDGAVGLRPLVGEAIRAIVASAPKSAWIAPSEVRILTAYGLRHPVACHPVGVDGLVATLPPSRNLWRITHVPTGRRLGPLYLSLDDLRAAVAAAEREVGAVDWLGVLDGSSGATPPLNALSWIAALPVRAKP